MKIQKNYLFLGLLICLVLLSYIPSLFSGFVSDDIHAIVESEGALKHPSYILMIPHFMIRLALYFVAYKLGGLNPAVFRSINIFFHIGVVILVYLIAPYFSKKKHLPLIVAAITAVHPLMIESVTWISGGIYAQSAFFLLLSFLIYIKNHANFKKSKSILSLFFYILALSSSEKVIVFPLILILYEYCFYSLKNNWEKIIPFGLISFFWVLILIPYVGPRMEYFQTTRGAGLQPVNPFFQIPVVIGAYLQLFFWPQNLSHYHYDIIFSFGNMALNFILFTVFIFGLIYTFIKNRLVFFFLCFFVVGLGITLNSLGISWPVAERYVYLPSIGLYFITGYFFSYLIEKKNFDRVSWISFAIIVISLFIRTVIRNQDWKNSETLWLATAKASPNYVASQNNAANIYVIKGDYEKAVTAYKKAIELNPNYPYTYYNLGYTLRLMKRHHEAVLFLNKSIQLDPKYWKSYEQLGGIFFELGDFENSELNVKKAIALAPDNSMLYAKLGTLRLLKEDKNGAIAAFEKALELDPKNEVARKKLDELF